MYKTPSSFVTLTYDEKHVPVIDGKLSLMKTHAQAYIDKLRNCSMGKVRYFGVGEYGERTLRPHYHFLLFGQPAEKWEDYFKEKWDFGQVHVAEAHKKSAAYVCGYATKKMTKADDPRLEGRIPEFAIYSKFPPLGHGYAACIEAAMYGRQGSQMVAQLGDVPKKIKIEGKEYPLSNSMIAELRKRINILDINPNTESWCIDEKTITAEQRERAAKQCENQWELAKRKRFNSRRQRTNEL